MPSQDRVLIGDRILERAEALLPVSDRGFLYGDAVYETLRCYAGRPFLLDAHLARLRRSATALYMTLPWTDDALRDRLMGLLAANGIGDGRIRITVTRGEGDLRARPETMLAPRLVITTEPLPALTAERWEQGVAVEIAGRLRNLPGALDPAIKSGNFLNNLLARFEMKSSDSFEVLLPNHRGELGEGSLANFFLVDADGTLRTPAADSGILVGITRELVLKLARAEGLPAEEGRVLPEDLLASREAFLTASTLEVLPIARVEGRTLQACPGPVTRRLRERYHERVRAELGCDPYPG